jgi:hypothetical protein
MTASIVFQSASKELVGDVDVHSIEDRNLARDQCSIYVGALATFKFQVRRSDDQVFELVSFHFQMSDIFCCWSLAFHA